MPELPEVETTKTSLQPLLGQTVTHVQVRQHSLRWPVPDDLSKLTGQKLLRLERRAKYILAHFDKDALLLHLGMSGSFSICNAQDELRKHDHVVLQFSDGQFGDNEGQITELRYHDPRRFGCMLWLENGTHTLLSKLGPEPLDNEFDANYLASKLKGKSTAIKVAIMDNAVVVGVGNIYATESLFNTGIHPARPAHSLTMPEIEKLVLEIKRILKQAIDLGGSTLRDYTNAMGENGYFQQTLLAYGRAGELCVNCDTELENLKLGQRASVFCPCCQPLK
ncbi:bifunctional DNA-formamidopyrimidine glycosylase/DNA-(apurinic or apyrimidinic site) lyase [Alkanindiges illinoisensis]|uniref:Formamidopyrimidine-DNA glycosylase n=1 Tax=Alkanindiges illinoisensis TaxID=197183 RepID=A0A4Y7XER0_9GAMM|nr:bifunctional DNA-formamidopyrimidine glycosylase/DNA-(apurinic or apyrimidinic site) lyase [Alkanindiges illinoisensis]TEU30277.1 bifunctional DNA-formamidopyrimidine glycosylase/DNA-(apurinic or apyrimidinic site) lyase [Alkanindiges illinoisensis]